MRPGPKPKVSVLERGALREAFQPYLGRRQTGKLQFYRDHARRLGVDSQTIKRIVKDDTRPMSLDQKMVLRRAFKEVPTQHGARMRFYRDQATALGFHWVTIRTAVLG